MSTAISTYSKSDYINFVVLMVLGFLVIPMTVSSDYWFTSILIPLILKLGKPKTIPIAAAINPEIIRAPKNGSPSTRSIKLKQAKAPAAIKPAAPRANWPV